MDNSSTEIVIINKLDALCHEMKQPIQLINTIIDVMQSNLEKGDMNLIISNLNELRDSCQECDLIFNDIYKFVKNLIKHKKIK